MHRPLQCGKVFLEPDFDRACNMKFMRPPSFLRATNCCGTLRLVLPLIFFIAIAIAGALSNDLNFQVCIHLENSIDACTS
eukprot:4222455-Amphidinium_carterae.1